jgi:hypothetical protein
MLRSHLRMMRRLISWRLATLLWLARSALALRRGLSRPPCAVRCGPERRLIALKSRRVGVYEILGILLITHPEVWEVVKKSPEDRVAIAAIGRRVKNVLVPDLVDDLARDNIFVRVHEMESEKLPILAFDNIERVD